MINVCFEKPNVERFLECLQEDDPIQPPRPGWTAFH